jgi:hypothetical protein
VADRFERPVSPYYLYVDECHLLMETAGADLERILCRGRKYRISLTVIGQFLGQFRNDRVDMTPALLNLCRSFACFLHMHPDDLDVLKRYFGYPNLSFEELYHVADRPDGYDLIKLKDYSRSYTCGTSWSVGANQSRSRGTSEQRTESTSHTQGRGEAEAEQTAHAENRNMNGGTSENLDPYGKVLGRGKSGGGSTGSSDSSAKSRTRSSNSSDTSGSSVARGETEQRGDGSSAGVGGSESTAESESEKTAVVPRTREEWHPTGKLRRAIEDQFHLVAQTISTLQNRQAMVRLYGEERTFRMDVGDVPDAYPEPGEMARRVRAFKELVFAAHPRVYFRPDLSAAAQDARLAAWLALHAPAAPPGPPPPADNGWGN